MIPPSSDFIQRVKAARLAVGVSQSQLAEVIGLTRAGYTAIEAGSSRLLYDHAVALSNYMGVAIHFTAPPPLAEPSPQVAKAKARKLIHSLQRRLERVERLLARKG